MAEQTPTLTNEHKPTVTEEEKPTLADWIKEKYESIKDVPFKGCYDHSQFLLGMDRHIIKVQSGGVVYDTLRDIVTNDSGDDIWKGITIEYGTIKLWAKKVEGSGNGPFKITHVEYVTGLNWVNKYDGLFNITVESEC